MKTGIYIFKCFIENGQNISVYISIVEKKNDKKNNNLLPN